MLELVHKSGFVYNDLKLENILLSNSSGVPDEQSYDPKDSLARANLVLTDYGLTTRWLDSKTGLHIGQSEVSCFGGNIYFASINQLQFLRTSRRDDLHSLMYMLIYLLNRQSLRSISKALDRDDLTPQ